MSHVAIFIIFSKWRLSVHGLFNSLPWFLPFSVVSVKQLSVRSGLGVRHSAVAIGQGTVQARVQLQYMACLYKIQHKISQLVGNRAADRIQIFLVFPIWAVIKKRPFGKWQRNQNKSSLGAVKMDKSCLQKIVKIWSKRLRESEFTVLKLKQKRLRIMVWVQRLRLRESEFTALKLKQTKANM